MTRELQFEPRKTDSRSTEYSVGLAAGLGIDLGVGTTKAYTIAATLYTLKTREADAWIAAVEADIEKMLEDIEHENTIAILSQFDQPVEEMNLVDLAPLRALQGELALANERRKKIGHAQKEATRVLHEEIQDAEVGKRLTSAYAKHVAFEIDDDTTYGEAKELEGRADGAAQVLLNLYFVHIAPLKPTSQEHKILRRGFTKDRPSTMPDLVLARTEIRKGKEAAQKEQERLKEEAAALKPKTSSQYALDARIANEAAKAAAEIAAQGEEE